MDGTRDDPDLKEGRLEAIPMQKVFEGYSDRKDKKFNVDLKKGNKSIDESKNWFPVAETWRLWIFRVVDDTSASRTSIAFSLISSGAVIISTIILLISSLPEWRFPQYGESENDTAPVLDQVELVCTLFFTVEYGLRILTASSATTWYLLHGEWKGPEGQTTPDSSEKMSSCGRCCIACGDTIGCTVAFRTHLAKTWIFFSRPLNIIDLVAIMPFYLESATGASINLTSLRIGRLIRLVKLFKSNKMIPLLMNVVTHAANILLQISGLLLVFVLIAACFIFICEQGEWDDNDKIFKRETVFGDMEPTPFDSVYISMWWVIVTFTTVGYGDMAPATPAGRAVGCIIIFCSLILFAIPITVVTDVFMQELNKSEEEHTKKGENHFYLEPWRSNRKREKAQAEGRLFHKLQEEIQHRIVHGNTTRKDKPIEWLPARGNTMDKIFQLFEDNSSGVISQAVQTSIRAAIIMSAMAITVESLPAYRFPNFGEEEGDSAPVFADIETAAVSLFTVDLVMRFISVPFTKAEFLIKCDYEFPSPDEKENSNEGSCSDQEEKGVPRRNKKLSGMKNSLNTASHMQKEPTALKKLFVWVFSPMTIVDIFSTVPFYIERFVPSLPSVSFLRVLRLLRLLRLAKLARSLRGLQILTTALENSIKPLTSLGVILIGWTIFCSSVMFYCEQGEWNEQRGYYERATFFGEKERSPYRSIPDTFYWMVVTMTTVGYGDLFPTSLAGRIIGSFILFISIICLAVPITIVAVNIDKASQDFMAQLRRPTTEKEEDEKGNVRVFDDDGVSGEDSALDFAENLYKLVGKAHLALEKIETNVQPFIDKIGTDAVQAAKEGKRRGFLPPECLELILNALVLLQKKSKSVSRSVNGLVNTELQVFNALPCKLLFRSAIDRHRSLAARAMFLEWRNYSQKQKLQRISKNVRPSEINRTNEETSEGKNSNVCLSKALYCRVESKDSQATVQAANRDRLEEREPSTAGIGTKLANAYYPRDESTIGSLRSARGSQ